MRPLLIALAMSAPCLTGPARAAPSSPCSASVIVQRGDTISSIASRCDVSEATLLASNPSVQSSGDLMVGGALRTRSADGGQRVGMALNSLANNAGNAVSALADRVGSSAQGLLDRNPDLKTRLQGLGDQVGLTDRDSDRSVAVAPRSGPPGSTVTVTATGLAKGQRMTIGAGAPGTAVEAIHDARTSDEGTLSANVRVPDAADPGKQLVFVVIGASNAIEGRSGRFDVTR